MEVKIVEKVAADLNIGAKQVENTLKLLEEGGTVPFIARYRKEMTGNLDEEQILFIQKQYDYQQNLKKRKEDVLRIIETQGKLTPEIIASVEACQKLSQVEDIYRPYQQKRKTRASEAIRKGLKPLADKILSCPCYLDLHNEAFQYLSEELVDETDVLQGAKDIIAEVVADNAALRAKIRENVFERSFIITKVKKDNPDKEGVYKLYYDHKEKLKYLEPHRIMAITRAENEKVITVDLEYDKEYLFNYALRGVLKQRQTNLAQLIEEAVRDGLTRLAFPSIEKEVRNELTEKAEEKSIDIFSLNLEKLLLQAPIKGKTVLGFDPGYRNGCKLAVVDKNGKLLEVEKIYPHAPQNKKKEAEAVLLKLFKQYDIAIVAIGNGTASRESQELVAEVINKHNLKLQYALVSEAGASIYSASQAARDEFPQLAVEERSAVSIARRILDPLSELIKIDPKSIGVGQYQHDLPAKKLQERLDFAIEKSVNRVGADLNTASYELLVHIAGLNKTTAANIVAYRDEHGSFKNRNELLNVKRVSEKVYEQAAGFLRINEGQEPLDSTAIHPESYGLAREIIKMSGEVELGSKKLNEALDKLLNDGALKQLATDKYTFEDVISALRAPKRDYRDNCEGPLLRGDVLDFKDLKVNDKLQGVVRNVVDFGAFIDIGLHDDGLAHRSKLTTKRINHPSEVVTVGDIVDVWVYELDVERKRVALTLIEPDKI